MGAQKDLVVPEEKVLKLFNIRLPHWSSSSRLAVFRTSRALDDHRFSL